MKSFLAATILLFSTSITASTVTHVPASSKIVLTPENTVIYRNEVDEMSAVQTAASLLKLHALRKDESQPLYLVLDCPGGSIYSGEAFIQAVKLIPNVKTVTLFAASMCSAIAQALPGERLIAENGIMMFHRAKGVFKGQFEDGEVESQLNLWKSIVRAMEQRNADRMSLSLETYKQLVKDELWIYGDSNIERGAADKKVDIECSQELTDLRYSESYESFFGNYQLEYSGCPLLRAPLKVSQGE